MIFTTVAVNKIVDGDTFYAEVSRRIELDSESYLLHVVKMKCRVITIDTPERGEKDYDVARISLVDTLANTNPLELETYGKDNFGRTLVDVYRKGDRSNTVSKTMLIMGWPPYVAK